MRNNKSANDLQDKYLEFLEHLDNHPWDEIPKVLEEIEELILSIISWREYLLKAYKNDRDAVWRKIMKLVTWDAKNIPELLDDLQQKVSHILTKTPEEIDREFWIFVKYLDWVILPPWEGSIQNWTQESEAKEEKILAESRYGKVLEILRENKIFADDIIAYSANLRDNQMRKTSYRVVQIPSISKTIFVCDQYWEASFVCDSLVYPEVFLDHTKSQIREQLDAQRVRHVLWWEEKLREFVFWEKEQKIIQEKSQKWNKKLKVRELDEYREEILRQFPTPEDWMNINNETIKHIDIFWNGLKYIANTIFWLWIIAPNSKQGLARIAQRIYWLWYEIVDVYLLAIDDWIIEIKKKFPTAESFMDLSIDDKAETYVKWKGLRYIHNTVFKLWQSSILRNRIHQANLAKEVYWWKHDVIDVHFWDIDVLKSKIRDSFKEQDIRKLGREGKSNFSFHWIKLYALASRIGSKWNPLANDKYLQNFCDLVWS